MQQNNKKYGKSIEKRKRKPLRVLICRLIFSDISYIGWTIALIEYESTIPTLWKTVRSFMQEYPQYIPKNNLMDFVSNNNGHSYNLCHFWSNFEIGDLNFFRSESYLRFFEYLDKAGGFFYERWGDAPVCTVL